MNLHLFGVHMSNKSWGKIGALISFLALLCALFFAINGLNIESEQKYFGYTLVLLLALFGYFNWFKEVASSKPRR